MAGRWRILRRLAQGGMGEVYEAKDLELGDLVALKTIRPEAAQEEQLGERFRREIQLARKVTHPSVCRIFDLGLHHQAPGDAGVMFLTMELLSGETLASRLKREGRFQPEEAWPLVRSIALGLGAAHKAGVIHRDFKPQNVMLVPGSAGVRAVVTDFGLARSAAPGGSLETSLTGEAILGTPAYMAPEQVEGRELSPASDLYSFGVVLYEMLTGHLPFTGSNPMSTALKRLKEPPEPPRSHVQDLDPRWETLLLRCLERDPAARPASMEELLEGLGASFSTPVPRPPRAARIGMFAALGVLLALGLGAGALLWRHEKVPAHDPVRPRRSVAILGFKNLSGRPEGAWLSTALAEMLGTELAAGGKLRAVSGEAVARMKLELELSDQESYSQETLERIQRNLGTDLVVVGSYLLLKRDGANRIRFDVRLQEAQAGETLASVAEAGTEEELFDLVSRAGAQLREKLGVGETSEEEAKQVRASLPSSPAAARLYAEGLGKLRLFDRVGAREALEAAAAAEPGSALVHAALAEAWSSLGYSEKAREEARRAFELAGPLSKEMQLSVEGLYREMHGEWRKAVSLYEALQAFFPDDLDHRLRLAQAQISAGKSREALLTVESLRRLPSPLRDDPRIDLTEARAAQGLSETARQRDAAARAVEKGKARGAQLLVADASLELGRALMALGQPKEGRELAEAAERIYATAGDRSGVGRALVDIGVLLRRQGELVAARAKIEEARALFEDLGDQSGVISAQLGLSLVLLNTGEFDAAIETLELAVSLCRKTGDRGALGYALQRLGRALSEKGSLAQGAEKFQEALSLFREIGDRIGLNVTLFHFAANLQRRGDLKGARAAFEESHIIDYELDNKGFIAWGAEGLGRVEVDQGELAAARKNFEEAIPLFRGTGEKGGLARSLVGRAEVLAAQGEFEAARKDREEALAIWSDVWDQAMVSDVRVALAGQRIDEGHAEQAVAEARLALEQVRQNGAALEWQIKALTVLGRALAAQGLPEEARPVLEEAVVAAARSELPAIGVPAVLASARLQAAGGRGPGLDAALERVQAALAEARQAGLVGYELDARLAAGELELAAGKTDEGRLHLASVQADAEARGFVLLARKAARAQTQRVP